MVISPFRNRVWWLVGCWLLTAASVPAAMPSVDQFKERFDNWRTAGKFDEFVKEHSLTRLDSFDWDSATFTVEPPDALRLEVSLSKETTLTDEQRQEADKQLQTLMKDGFLAKEAKQLFDSKKPEDTKLYEGLLLHAVAIIRSVGPPPKPETPTAPVTPSDSIVLPSACGCGPAVVATAGVPCDPCVDTCGRCGRAWRSVGCTRGCVGSCSCGGSCDCVAVVTAPVLPAPASRPSGAPSAPGRSVLQDRQVHAPRLAAPSPAVQLVSHRGILEQLNRRPAVAGSGMRDPALAAELFGAAYHAFWNRDYRTAGDYLSQALEFNTRDARLWYYQGLVQLALGKHDQAQTSLAEAIRLHAVLTDAQAAEVNRSLERVQGSLRQELHLALLLAKRLPAPAGDPLPPRRKDMVAAK